MDLFYIHLAFSDDLKTCIRYEIEDKSRIIKKLPEILQKQQLKEKVRTAKQDEVSLVYFSKRVCLGNNTFGRNACTKLGK